MNHIESASVIIKHGGKQPKSDLGALFRFAAGPDSRQSLAEPFDQTGYPIPGCEHPFAQGLALQFECLSADLLSETNLMVYLL